jgi:hypothetical protein
VPKRDVTAVPVSVAVTVVVELLEPLELEALLDDGVEADEELLEDVEPVEVEDPDVPDDEAVELLAPGRLEAAMGW